MVRHGRLSPPCRSPARRKAICQSAPRLRSCSRVGECSRVRGEEQRDCHEIVGAKWPRPGVSALPCGKERRYPSDDVRWLSFSWAKPQDVRPRDELGSSEASFEKRIADATEDVTSSISLVSGSRPRPCNIRVGYGSGQPVEPQSWRTTAASAASTIGACHVAHLGAPLAKTRHGDMIFYQR